MSKTIERVAVGVLVFSVSLLTLVGLLGIWEWVNGDVVWKSYSTIGVIALAALLVVGIAQITGRYYEGQQPVAPAPESPTWRAARNLVLGFLGIVFLIFTAMAIAAIWDFIGGNALYHAFSSMGLLFTSGVILLVAFRQIE